MGAPHPGLHLASTDILYLISTYRYRFQFANVLVNQADCTEILSPTWGAVNYEASDRLINNQKSKLGN